MQLRGTRAVNSSTPPLYILSCELMAIILLRELETGGCIPDDECTSDAQDIIQEEATGRLRAPTATSISRKAHALTQPRA